MELAKPFRMSQPAISKHLKVLERAGLIVRSRRAQSRPCRLEARPLREVADWTERYRRYWERSFERLDALDRKSTRLNSSHLGISYAVFCLKKKKTKHY